MSRERLRGESLWVVDLRQKGFSARSYKKEGAAKKLRTSFLRDQSIRMVRIVTLIGRTFRLTVPLK